jgi:hypothetical protein
MRKDIEFKTEDGIKLRGWHYLPEKRTGKVLTIVMAHGFSAVKEMYLRLLHVVAERQKISPQALLGVRFLASEILRLRSPNLRTSNGR